MSDVSRAEGSGPQVEAGRTLSRPTETVVDIGLHNGRAVTMRVLPASFGSGVCFRDLESGVEIPALAENVSDTSRCTRLSAGGAAIQTVEHVLSALAGLGVTDAVVECSGGEMPAVDGSAAPFVTLIRAAGLSDGERETEFVRIAEPCVVHGPGDTTIVAVPAEAFQATVVLNYPRQGYLGTLAATFHAGQDDYATCIAPARTFGFLSELDTLRSHGLALGASYDNAIVMLEDGYDTRLRFPNEIVRHKILDLMGDLMLVGAPVRAHVIAIKPGHALNVTLASQLRESIRRTQRSC